MRCINFIVIAAALSVFGWSACQAAGSFQKPEPREIDAGVPSISMPSMPSPTASDLVDGCGRGRIRDPQAHGCRGPADIR